MTDITTKKSRQQLYADKYAFNPTDTTPVYTLDLINELVEQERLAAENKMLRSRIETLELLLVASRSSSSSSHVIYDIKGRLS